MGKHYKLIDYERDETRVAALARLMLRYIGEDFEDARIPQEDAKSVEDGVPFGVLPALEENGKVVAIHYGIARYLAHRHDLAGKTPEEKADCGMIVDGLRILIGPLSFMMKGKSEEERKEIGQQYFKEKGLRILGQFDKLLKKHEDRDYFVSNEITWCDLAVGSFCAFLQTRQASFLDPYPSLKAFTEKMATVPAVKQHLQERA